MQPELGEWTDVDVGVVFVLFEDVLELLRDLHLPEGRPCLSVVEVST